MTFSSSFFFKNQSHDEESGATVRGESRLHPSGVFALRHRGRQQQRPVVVSSTDIDDALIALRH